MNVVDLANFHFSYTLYYTFFWGWIGRMKRITKPPEDLDRIHL